MGSDQKQSDQSPSGFPSGLGTEVGALVHKRTAGSSTSCPLSMSDALYDRQGPVRAQAGNVRQGRPGRVSLEGVARSAQGGRHYL